MFWNILEMFSSFVLSVFEKGWFSIKKKPAMLKIPLKCWKKTMFENPQRLDGMKTFFDTTFWQPLIYHPVHLEVFYSQEERVGSSSNFLDFSGRCWLVKKAIFLLVIPLGNAWNVLVRKILELHGGLASGNTDVPTTYIVLTEENLHQFML